MGSIRDTHLPGLISHPIGLGPGSLAADPALCHHAAAVPTYDYQCRSCGSVTEVIHSMLEDGPTTCEQCGGALRRMVFPTGIIFKGSGFYRNDSRKSSSSSSDAPSSKPASPKAAGTSESTPSKGDTSSD